MTDCSNQSIGTYHDIIPDINFSDIKDRKVIVSGEIVTYVDLLTVITVESLGDPDFLTDTSKHLLKLSILSFIVQIINSVILTALNNGICFSSFNLGIVITIF